MKRPLRGHEVTDLRGRRRECSALERLLEDVRAGTSATLVLRGDPGVGKSALLGYAIESAADFRLMRATGVEAEMELAYAGLHQLCVPLLDGLERLPPPQRDALATAFGIRPGAPQDRFLVGLAVLGLLSEAAAERPLLCVVDDSQWLDSASVAALAFVARRVFAESVALLFATREHNGELTGLPALALGGLAEPDARELLDAVVTGPLDDRVRDRILAETHGNPLALLELPRALGAADLAGGFALPDAPLTGLIEASFRQRLEPLPDDTRLLVLAAAADPVGDPALLWRAAATLGIGREAVAPAEETGLLTVGIRVTFFHPLVRSAVYRAASSDSRRAVHHALAEATDDSHDPDRRAWHRAQAAAGPDEDVAAELERSAGRAQARGGLAAAAAFLERAAELTPDPSERVERTLAAAQVKLNAGAAEPALELLAATELNPVDELQVARVERLRARLTFAQQRSSDALPLLLRAARRLEQLDVELAREAYIEALGAALMTGQRDPVEQAAATLRALPTTKSAGAFELLLTGQALVITDGRAAAIPVLKQALSAFRAAPVGPDDVQTLPYAGLVALWLWDEASLEEISRRNVQMARDAGALASLPQALEMHCVSMIESGDFATAQALLDEAQAVTDAIGSAPIDDAALFLAGWRGEEAAAIELIEASIRDAGARGEESTITVAEYARAVLFNGLGRHEEALVAAQRASEHHPAKAYTRALPEFIEAAARCGKPEIGEDAVSKFSESTSLSGSDWALGLEARVRALVSEGEAADAFYRQAIERLGRTRIRTELARAHLLYGERLRRDRRRVDAREHLRAAHELFSAMGAEAFAERARRELMATGETARKRRVETRSELTPQEAQIARLAREGLSNPEIGGRLYISPRTVEYHLHKVFSKLDITSRSQLDRALPGES